MSFPDSQLTPEPVKDEAIISRDYIQVLFDIQDFICWEALKNQLVKKISIDIKPKKGGKL